MIKYKIIRCYSVYDDTMRDIEEELEKQLNELIESSVVTMTQEHRTYSFLIKYKD